MYVSMKGMLKRANEGNYAVMAINCFNIETARAVINAAQSLRAPIIINIVQEHFTTFLLDVVNFKISGSKYPFFSFLEMYTLVCSFVVFPFLIVTLLVFALIFVILDALYVTAFLPDALIVALAS